MKSYAKRQATAYSICASVLLLFANHAARAQDYAEAALATTTQSSNAQTAAAAKAQYSHCTIYSSAGCSSANATSHAITSAERGAASMPVWSGQAGLRSAQIAIDLANTCRWPDNAAGNSTTDVFVPFKTNFEWTNFVNAAGVPGSKTASLVSLAHCARAGGISIPANDPASPPSDSANRCYDAGHHLLTSSAPFVVTAYGRVNEHRTLTPVGMNFACYDAAGSGPWTKTVTSFSLLGLDADRAGGSSANAANSDWSVIAVTYTGAPTPINGLCGSTVNGVKLSSAPSGPELCDTGTPTALTGDITSGWAWSCQGLRAVRTQRAAPAMRLPYARRRLWLITAIQAQTPCTGLVSACPIRA